jgi:hypothetical protein
VLLLLLPKESNGEQAAPLGCCRLGRQQPGPDQLINQSINQST